MLAILQIIAYNPALKLIIITNKRQFIVITIISITMEVIDLGGLQCLY